MEEDEKTFEAVDKRCVRESERRERDGRREKIERQKEEREKETEGARERERQRGREGERERERERRGLGGQGGIARESGKCGARTRQQCHTLWHCGTGCQSRASCQCQFD